MQIVFARNQILSKFSAKEELHISLPLGLVVVVVVVVVVVAPAA